MKTVSISGSLRSNVGTKDARALRAQGLIPCVIYGGKEQIAFAAEATQFKPLVYTSDAHIVKLDVGGQKYDAVMQEIQFHKVTDKILHVDFLQVVPNKPVTMELPIKITGNSPGVRAGGKLQRKLRALKVSGATDKMPESIEIAIDKLEIGDTIKVGDLKRDGIKFLNDPNVSVVAVRITRNVVEETPAAAAAAPAAAAKPADAKAPAADAKAPAKK